MPNLLKLFFFVFFIFIQETHCQQNKRNDSLKPKVQDLKVGLVLSGGGAKGLAHIGALKVIEQSGVRIDYIGGSSMGAIIGALYASGYKANELDSIFRKVDYNNFIQDILPRDAKTFYERDDAEKYAITLPFDKFKVGLPKGLSRGQNLYNLFSRYTGHVNHINDFNKLPIPFFCTATKISNGKQVILDKGYLPEAVAASSALPSIFSPVEIQEALLMDGGVANNYPIDEIKAKGAEIVIGVDVQDSLIPVEQLNSATSILVQIGNFRTIKSMEDKAPKTDVYIHPPIMKFSVLAFDQVDEIITTGEQSAFEHYESLKNIASRQIKRKPLQIKKTQSDSIRIDHLKILGNKKYNRAYIKGKLKLYEFPLLTTYDKLNEGINNLTATGNFDRVNHQLISKNGF